MLTFCELAHQMTIDDAVMARHIDALLRDFVEDHRTLFGFWDGPLIEGALLYGAFFVKEFQEAQPIFLPSFLCSI